MKIIQKNFLRECCESHLSVLTNIFIHLEVLQIMLRLCNYIYFVVVAEFWKCSLLVIFAVVTLHLYHLACRNIVHVTIYPVIEINMKKYAEFGHKSR